MLKEAALILGGAIAGAAGLGAVEGLAAGGSIKVRGPAVQAEVATSNCDLMATKVVDAGAWKGTAANVLSVCFVRNADKKCIARVDGDIELSGDVGSLPADTLSAIGAKVVAAPADEVAK